MPGPAPPLPPGPPPPQPPYTQQQDAQAAHAAAWAAYYASQGQTGAGATYAAPTTQSAGQTAAGGAANPYANYGYSAHASAQHSAFIQGGQPAGQTYRPPGAQTPANATPAPYVAPAYGYQAPQAYGQQYPQQPAAGQPAYNWPASQPAQPYRPPVAAGYNSPGQTYHPPNQPYTPSPMRPSASPSPGPNRPYQPQPRIPSGPGRPPMAGPGTPPHFPPAKRPRFDGPGNQNAPLGPSGPMNNANMQNRPPTMHGPVRPTGPAMGQQPYVPRPPLPASLPAAPRGPGGSVPLGPSNTGPNPGSAPIIRPPIHLGLNGPPPPLPFGGSMRGRPVRGGMHGNGAGGHGVGGGMGRNGPVNAPRGPAGMRRPEPSRQNRENDRKRRDKEREKTKEKDEKITMTDFRIVGIELKALGWSWGLTGDAVVAESQEADEEGVGKAEEAQVLQEDASEAKEVKDESNEALMSGQKKQEDGAESAEGDIGKDIVKKEDVAESAIEHIGGERAEKTEVKDAPGESVVTEVKIESAESVEPSENVDPSENIEEKRGEKRKAKTPDGDDEGSSPKKRPGEYLLTHRKPNDPVESSTTPSASSVHESNQNRFRIYFESPPELDRVPKALRRNPNKRWRRASSSVAPSVPEGRAVREGTVGTTAGLEDVSEEIGATADGGGERNGDAEVSKEERTEATEVEQIVDAQADTSAPEEAIAADSEVATAEATASAEEIAKPAVTDVSGLTESAVDEAAADQSQANVEADGAENIGDVSMMTDLGAVTAISELVEAAQETVVPTKEPQDSSEAPAQSIETSKPDTETPKIKLQGIHSLPPKPQTTASSSALPPTPKLATTETPAEGSTSAENTASAYKSRTRRRSSVSSQESIDETLPDLDVPTPSVNRVSILYEGSQRRLCIDAAVVESVRIHREAGKIEMVLTKLDKGEEGKDLPKGVLAELYDTTDQRFANASVEKLEELWTDPNPTLPPLQRPLPDNPMILTVYLNKKRPLSEPKWCRTDGADDWLIEQFGPRKAAEGGWRGKLHIVDPDPAPTLQSILDSWAGSSNVGIASDRRTFTRTLQSDPNDLLEILLRLTRGDRNPTTSATLGPLATAIRADSPFASHQTHVSLAILAMYRLTTDYAAKAGEKSEVVNEKISDIIKSLPGGMIHRSLDGLFKEWKGK